MSKFTKEYFINKFEAIPEERWITGIYTDVSGTRCCAYGHCGASNDMLVFPQGSEALALSKLFQHTSYPNNINDGCDDRYKQSTPKQRILAALKDLK